ncbi:MAG: hypothetical protein DHS20C10_04790 [marine bacterium B5-7]|nr:MAG: hypothetical protein DHS20C10_04790 [marine bacterium B5-7]
MPDVIDIQTPHWIYVPQGYVAHLIVSASSMGAEGLLTDGFSACNIFVFRNARRIALCHADAKTPPMVIADTLKWVGEGATQTIYRRAMGRPVQEQLLNSDELKDVSFDIQEVAGNVDQVLVRFLSEEGKRSEISTFPPGYDAHDAMVLHHPEEEKLQTVQKANGLSSICTGEYIVRKRLIFDASAWMDFEEGAFMPDRHFPAAKQVWGRVSQHQGSAFEVAAEIEKIISEGVSVPILQSPESYAADISTSVMTILHNYDHEAILRANIVALVESPQHSRFFPSQNQEFSALLAAGPINLLYGIMHRLLTDNIMDAWPGVAAFREKLNACLFAYQEGSKYETIASARQALVARSDALATEAKKHYKEECYEAAENLYAECLGHIRRSCLPSDKRFSGVLYNLARVHMKLKHEPSAIVEMLKECIELREAHDPGNTPGIAKAKLALEECRQAISAKRVLPTPGQTT